MTYQQLETEIIRLNDLTVFPPTDQPIINEARRLLKLLNFNNFLVNYRNFVETFYLLNRQDNESAAGVGNLDQSDTREEKKEIFTDQGKEYILTNIAEPLQTKYQRLFYQISYWFNNVEIVDRNILRTIFDLRVDYQGYYPLSVKPEISRYFQPLMEGPVRLASHRLLWLIDQFFPGYSKNFYLQQQEMKARS